MFYVSLSADYRAELRHHLVAEGRVGRYGRGLSGAWGGSGITLTGFIHLVTITVGSLTSPDFT